MPPVISSKTDLRSVEGVAALIDVADLHRLAQAKRARVRLLLPRDHAEQRGLAGAVGTDDADDAAGRQRERQIVHQQLVAVGLAHAARFDHDVAEPRARRNVDLDLLELLRRVLVEQLLVGVEARLALGLTRARRHADPLELALQRLLTLALGLLLLGQPLLLLVEPRGVVALPRDALAAIELENPLGRVVEEVAVVRHRHHGALVFLEEPFEPRHRLGVEVVRGLVEQQQVRRLEQQPAERHAAALAARQRRDVGLRRRAAQRVHRELELRVDFPGVERVDAVLQAALLFQHLVHRLGRQILAELHVELVVTIEDGLGRRHAFLDVALHRLGRVELRLLVQEADRDAVGGKRLADERRVLAGHDLEQRALAGAVQAEHADLGAWQEREPDVLEYLGVGRMNLPEPLHRVDVLHSIQKRCKTASISGVRRGGSLPACRAV